MRLERKSLPHSQRRPKGWEVGLGAAGLLPCPPGAPLVKPLQVNPQDPAHYGALTSLPNLYPSGSAEASFLLWVSDRQPVSPRLEYSPRDMNMWWSHAYHTVRRRPSCSGR